MWKRHRVDWHWSREKARKWECLGVFSFWGGQLPEQPHLSGVQLSGECQAHDCPGFSQPCEGGLMVMINPPADGKTLACG